MLEPRDVHSARFGVQTEGPNDAHSLAHAAVRSGRLFGRVGAKFITDRPGFDATRLRQLAEAADLYGPNNIGEDLTPTDGAFDTLRFRPVAGGRAVVLVTSGNRSFEDQPTRRELLEYLNRIKSDLREKAELASAGQGPDFR